MMPFDWQFGKFLQHKKIRIFTCYLAIELQNTIKFLYFVSKTIIVFKETLYLFNT